MAYLPSELFVCPDDKALLLFKQNSYFCTHCGKTYVVKGDVPDFMAVSNEVETIQKDLYEKMAGSITSYRYFLEYPYLLNHFHRKEWIDLLKIKPGMKILELGTQNGVHIRYLKHRYPFISNNDIVGVDIAIKPLQMGRIADTFHYTAASIYNLPFADTTFDIVLMPGILEHLEDPLSAIKEVSRVMKENAEYSAYFVVKDYGFSFHWVTNDFLKIKRLIKKNTVDIGHDFETVIQRYDTYADCLTRNGLIIERKRRVNLILEPTIDFIFSKLLELVKIPFRMVKYVSAKKLSSNNIGDVRSPVIPSGNHQASNMRDYIFLIMHYTMKIVYILSKVEGLFLGTSCGLSVLIHGRKRTTLMVGKEAQIKK